MDGKKYPQINNYQLIQTLGSGLTAKVKLAIDLKTGKKVAVKIFKKTTNFEQNKTALMKEFLIMQELHHLNLINLIEILENCDYCKTNGTIDKRMAIVIEYAGGGEFFEFVSQCGQFNEKQCRFYFNQILNGLQYLHSKGVAHRDMKPENLLFDENFVLKLADFGFSAHLQGSDKSGYMHTVLGTESYMAPEIATRNYKGEQVDLFATAIVLFIMLTGHPPFMKADKTDPFYKLLMTQKHETFWKAHSRNKPSGFWTNSLKDFFNRMFAFNPLERLNMSEIKQHEWVTGEQDSQDEILKEFSKKKELVDAQLNKARLEKQKLKEQQKQNSGNQGKQAMFTGVKFRSGDDIKNEFSDVENLYLNERIKSKKLVKNLGDPKKVYQIKQSDIVSLVDPEYLAKFLLKNKDKFCQEIDLIDDNLYNLICTCESNFEGVFSEEDKLESKFNIQFCKLNEDSIHVNIIEDQENSNHILFLEARQEIAKLIKEMEQAKPELQQPKQEQSQQQQIAQ